MGPQIEEEIGELLDQILPKLQRDILGEQPAYGVRTITAVVGSSHLCVDG